VLGRGSRLSLYREWFPILRMTAVVMGAFAGLCALHYRLNPGSAWTCGDTMLRLLPMSEWGFGKRADVPVPLTLPPEVIKGKVARCRITRLRPAPLPGKAAKPGQPPGRNTVVRVAVNKGGVRQYRVVNSDSIPMFFDMQAAAIRVVRGRSRRRFIPPPPGPLTANLPVMPSLATVLPNPFTMVSRRHPMTVMSGRDIPCSMARGLTRRGEGIRVGIVEVVRAEAVKVEPVR
jgi:hypothetical protein